jgi:hypothetical protein
MNDRTLSKLIPREALGNNKKKRKHIKQTMRNKKMKAIWMWKRQRKLLLGRDRKGRETVVRLRLLKIHRKRLSRRSQEVKNQ